MMRRYGKQNFLRITVAVFAVISCFITGVLTFGCDPTSDSEEINAFAKRSLIVNRYDPNDPTSPPEAPIIDPLLVNPWGTAIRSAGLGGHFWLANQGSSSSTTYIGDVFDDEGNFVPLFQDSLKVVAVEGTPIGIVFSNSATDFPVTGPLCSDEGAPVCDPGEPSFLGEFTGPSRFIIATEEGQIVAWTEGTIDGQFGRLRRFFTIVDNSEEGALYRGLAIAQNGSEQFLYAANFSQDRIEVYDGQWNQIDDGSGFFAKPSDVPADYVPFNIQELGGSLYVAYAQLIQPGDPDFDPAEPFTERACPGCGYVAVFDLEGNHIRTLEGGGLLNAPWGLEVAPPDDFGEFNGDLLVGNFGDGTIVAFDLDSGAQLDYMRDLNGEEIAIDGLWAIFFGNGASLGRADYLYWTAGFNDETDGGFGSLNWFAVPNPNP